MDWLAARFLVLGRGWWRFLCLAILVSDCVTLTRAYRKYKPRTSEDQEITYAPFEPYEQGEVGYYGDSKNYQRERINEGAPDTATYPRKFESVYPRQVCPGMVGPLGGGQYYCIGKEYGYCDRRSGTCFCNMGYQGVDCGSCRASHYRSGSLCYPKKLCPNDCKGHGTCNFATGECQCNTGYWGEDCSKLDCQRFDPLCLRCTKFGCTVCMEGYTVDPKAANSDGYYNSTCKSCADFDPRCASCNSKKCLTCADPLLNSVRRSGYRSMDASVSDDEFERQLSIALPFGTQDFRFFDDAEHFDIVADDSNSLKAAAKKCEQGKDLDESWYCSNVSITHEVCGHRGTVTWKSPTYLIKESAGYIPVTLVRTGGGFGSFEVSYALVHEATNRSDVTPTVAYTTEQTIYFEEGVIEKTFRIMIHDDRDYEGDERFYLSLREPTGSSSTVTLGPQRITYITIQDDDQPLTGWTSTRLYGDFDCIAGRTCNFTIDAYSTVGTRQYSGGDRWFIILSDAGAPAMLNEGGFASAWSLGLQQRESMTPGVVVDQQNGTYRGSWSLKKQGKHVLHAYLAVGGDTDDLSWDHSNGGGGLLGTYYDSSFLEPDTIAFSRVDQVINFTWGYGRVTEFATDYVSIRWEGAVLADHTEEYTFTLVADDSVRLWIDYDLIIDQWHVRLGGRSVAGVVPLRHGELHHIVLEYREIQDLAKISLFWESSSTQKSIVPQDHLFHLHELDASPKEITVVSAETSGSKSDCVGLGLYSGVAGQQFTFTVRPRDEFANLRNDDDPTLLALDPFTSEAILSRNDGEGFGISNVSVTFHYVAANAEFVGTYTPFISGQYKLNVRHNDDLQHLIGSPFTVDVAPAKTFAKRCNVFGIFSFQSWNVGAVETFNLTARDAMNNMRLIGGDKFEVIAYLNRGGASIDRNNDLVNLDLENSKLAEVVHGSVHDHGDGNFTVRIRPIKKGEYTLAVTLGGHHVAKSPYSVLVSVGTASSAASVAVGRGLYTARATFESVFTLQARDAYSNDLETDSGWAIEGHILAPGSGSTPSKVPLNVTMHGDGIARVRYTPKIAGENLMTVLLNGMHISGSPFKVNVADGPLDASTSMATGSGLYNAEAGKIGEFTVQARDPFKNTRSDDGDNGVIYTDGRLQYTRQDIGRDPGVDDSFKVTLKLLSNLSSVNTPSHQGLNYRGCMGGGSISSPLCEGGETEFIGEAKYLGNGLHRIRYNVTARGVYNLSILANSSSSYLDESVGHSGDMEHIMGSPFTPYVASTSASAVYSNIWGQGLEDNVAGYDQRLWIQTVDLFGNNLTRGGDMIYVDVTLHRASPNASYGPAFLFPEDAPRSAYRPLVVDFDNGVYSTLYIPIVSGDYVVRSTLMQPGGLDATYYEQGSFTRPMEKREDSQIAFDWGYYQYNAPSSSAPDLDTKPGVVQANRSALTAPVDYWSARWTGYLKAPLHEEEIMLYVKVAEATDMVSVFLDGVPLVGGGDLGEGHHAGPSLIVGGVADTLSRQPHRKRFHDVYRSVSPRQGSSRTVNTRDDKLDSSLPTGANSAHPYQVEKRPMVRAEEEAFSYERVRYAFRDSSLAHLDLADGSAVSTSKLAEADAVEATAAIEAFEGRGERRALWATWPGNASLALAATERTTAFGQLEYATALLFPRPGQLHTLEVTYRHKTGVAAIELSWESPSMQPRQPIPPEYFFRALPLSKTEYPIYIEPDATHPPTSTAIGRGLFTAVSGMVQTFTVEVRDQWSNLRLKGGDIVSVVGTGPGTAHFTGDIQDNGDGTYEVSYYPMVSGTYSMSVVVGSTGLHRDFGYFNVEESLANSHIVGSPFSLTVKEGSTYAASCTAFGEATYRFDVGEVDSIARSSLDSHSAMLDPYANGAASTYPPTFTIMAKDLHHNRRPIGGDAFEIFLEPIDDDTSPHSVGIGEDIDADQNLGVVRETLTRHEVGISADMGDGTYLATYASNRSGYFRMNVRLRSAGGGLLAEYYGNDQLLGDPIVLDAKDRGYSSSFMGAGTHGYGVPITGRVESPVKWSGWNVTSSTTVTMVDTTLPPNELSTVTNKTTTVIRGHGGAKGVRWSGWLTAPITEEYTFMLFASDGARLYVGEDLLIHIDRSKTRHRSSTTARLVHESAQMTISVNSSIMEGESLHRQTSPVSQAYARSGGAAVLDIDSIQASDSQTSAPVVLSADRIHKIRVESSTRGGHSADVALFWQSARTPLQLVPDAFLHPPDTNEKDATRPGEHIAGSPFLVYGLPARPAPENCVAEGRGRRFTDDPNSGHTLYAYTNRTSYLEIRAHDIYGNILDRGGAEWFVRVNFHGTYANLHMTDSEVIKVAPTDANNGSYFVEYTPGRMQKRLSNKTPSAPGQYSIDVMLALPADGVSSFHGGGGGLTGTYFNNAFLSEPAFVTRIDDSINFDWLSNAGGYANAANYPMAGLKADGISVRWTGFIKAPIGDVYTFTLQANDGGRLYIDDELVVVSENNFIPGKGETARKGKVIMETGVLYRIRVEMQDRYSRAAVKLMWQSDRTPLQVVPSFFLYPGGEHIDGSPFPLNVFVN